MARAFLPFRQALAVLLVLSLFPLAFSAWVLFTPLDPHEAAAARICFYLLVAFCGALGTVVPYGLRSGEMASSCRQRSKAAWSVIALLVAAGVVLARYYRWEIRLVDVPDADALPLNTSGYAIEKLPFSFQVSFAKDRTIYFADASGDVYRADDSNPTATLTRIGHSGLRPRCLVVSSKGSIFVSGDKQPLLRSADGGRSWDKVLDIPVWRMAQDSASGTLYAGNYSKGRDVHAILLASKDDGKSWRQVFADPRLDHIHTVRFDPTFRRIYIAAGDGPPRGQAYSDDGGRTWQWILRGVKQGDTDAGISRSQILWGSDDRLGRIVRGPASLPRSGQTVLWSKGQQVWFVTAQDAQVFAGTFIEDRWNRQAVYFLASHDEGRSWQKLLEYGKSQPGPKGFIGDSRQLSRGGWLYFTDGNGQGYRVRRLPAAP